MAGRERNHIIDLARIAAVLMVVLFHSLLFRIELVSGGPVATAWEPGPQWWPFSWLVMILPLFFVAAATWTPLRWTRCPPGVWPISW